MTPVVVEVGPVTVRGPGAVAADRAAAAVAGVGDRLAVVDDRIVEVDSILREVLSAAAGGRARALALVVPSWWSARWVAAVSDAADAVADDVLVFRRAELLSGALGTAVTEVSRDLLAVAQPGRPLRVLPRDGDGLPSPMLVDVPPGVVAPARLVGRRTHRDDVAAAVGAIVTEPRSSLRGPALGAVAATVVAAAMAPWALGDRAPQQWRLLTEGRAAIEVPADWTIERVTAGPGSARVRIAAAGGLPALHLTQSVGPADLAQIAESLRQAITLEPAGVFVDIRSDGAAGDRAAVTYLEVRDGSRTQWAIVADGQVRIAVGCQSSPDGAEAIAVACARAVRSAHAVD